MSTKEMELMAHLLRRAGFTATRDELERYVAKGYAATVEELLHPGEPDHLPDDVIGRYHVDLSELRNSAATAALWMYRLITTSNHLEEKLALFWHGLLATGYAKLNQGRSQINQIEMFRRHGFGRFDTLLIELSKDPAMLFWLDNNDNHNGAINENYGRELMELFSMGIGNYTEQDIKEAARAFTGWTLGNAEYMVNRANKDSIWPYGRIAWHFEYLPEDHDDGEKTFLGETGNFNGADIVEIICRNEATPRFICTRLFQFFAADEVDDEGREVVEAMSKTYFESDHDIRSVLRTLFTSEYFRSERARFARVKGPVELVVSAVRLAGSYRKPTLNMGGRDVGVLASYMGQGLLQPPTVEGWHEGEEWIDSGALVERINFVAMQLGDVNLPGVRSIIDRMATDNGGTFAPDEMVDRCLDLIGPIRVSEGTHTALTEHVASRGNIDLKGHQQGDESEQRVGELLSLIASTREFQLA